jgi:hypothetical protein
VHGHSDGDGAGVMGDISSTTGSGVLGLNNGAGPGVKGLSDGTGVRGEGAPGVSGFSSTGVGVLGEADNGIGVYASSNSFIALYVLGPASFSTAGSGTLPANQNSAFVSNPGVTAQSHITVTLTGESIDRVGEGRFRPLPDPVGGASAGNGIRRSPHLEGRARDAVHLPDRGARVAPLPTAQSNPPAANRSTARSRSYS